VVDESEDESRLVPSARSGVCHREVRGGAAAQINLAEDTALAEAVDEGAVVGSVGRGAVNLDLEIDLVRYSHSKYSRSKHRSCQPRPSGRPGRYSIVATVGIGGRPARRKGYRCPRSTATARMRSCRARHRPSCSPG
jgi:hypothetical protein